APKIDLHQQGEIRIVKILNVRRLARHTSIVESDIDSAISLKRLLVKPLHRAAVANVDLTELERPADTLDLLAEAAPIGGAEARDKKICARPRKGQHSCPPDTGGAADHEHVLSGEVVFHLRHIRLSSHLRAAPAPSLAAAFMSDTPNNSPPPSC